MSKSPSDSGYSKEGKGTFIHNLACARFLHYSKRAYPALTPIHNDYPNIWDTTIYQKQSESSLTEIAGFGFLAAESSSNRYKFFLSIS